MLRMQQRCDMNEYLDVLLTCSLFAGIDRQELSELLGCFGAKLRLFQDGEIIFLEQSEVRDVVIVVSGAAQGSMVQSNGKNVIINTMNEGSVFGDVLAASQGHKSPVTVTSVGHTSALFIPFDKLISPCEKLCRRHSRLMENLARTIVEKYFELKDRINCLIKPNLREKIFTYLDSASKACGKGVFNIPLDRAQLADYLNADRSALSRELSAMKREGLIDYYKNTFKMLGGTGIG